MKKIIYRVQATCPHCCEEHQCWDLTITDEEQEIVDEFYRKNAGQSNIVLLLSDPPLYVERTLTCGCCKGKIHGLFAIRRDFALK